LNYGELPIQPVYAPPPLPQQGAPEFYVGQRPLGPPAPLDLKTVKFDASTEIVFSCRLPFVMPILDLNHKLQPEFPEVSLFGEINRSDHMYINACRFATLNILTAEERAIADRTFGAELRLYVDERAIAANYESSQPIQDSPSQSLNRARNEQSGAAVARSISQSVVSSERANQ
jgi:hypothetical protein